jgi:VanZ family protein
MSNNLTNRKEQVQLKSRSKINAWTAATLLLILTYYLSSIPGLRVLPILNQVNNLLQRFDTSITILAARLVYALPEQLAPAKTLTADFLSYARQNPVIMEFLLRKTGHVALFFIITLAAFFLLSFYLKSPGWTIALAFLASATLAVLDEVHQHFVIDRAGSIIDVFINLTGVSLAIGVVLLSLFLTSHWRH